MSADNGEPLGVLSKVAFLSKFHCGSISLAV